NGGSDVLPQTTVSKSQTEKASTPPPEKEKEGKSSSGKKQRRVKFDDNPCFLTRQASETDEESASETGVTSHEDGKSRPTDTVKRVIGAAAVEAIQGDEESSHFIPILPPSVSGVAVTPSSTIVPPSPA